MNIIVCIDDRKGMMFGGRRQSRDRAVVEDIGALAGDLLYIFPYSTVLFDGANIPFTVCENIQQNFPENAMIFVENLDIKQHFTVNLIDKIILYKWNRKYPADLFFNIEPESLGYRLTSTYEFAGFSHEKITREIYEK